ncbi:tail fiber protein [Cytophagaceae bacterium ABcell3]|nr:tail fiber protein [Cytophagaceae bacterium ABcell3]
MDLYLGLILPSAFNFDPVGMDYCHGQQISISQNQALFALIGTHFGGNGSTYFNLPDTRGRVVVGTGSGAGITPYQIGQTGGAEQVTLNVNEIPAHTHQAQGALNGSAPVTISSLHASGDLPATSQYGSSSTPGENAFPAKGPDLSEFRIGNNLYGPSDGTKIPVNVEVSAGEDAKASFNDVPVEVNVASTGGNMPHENRQPFVALNYLIVMQGIFPQRK